jgi:hypothetical protein
MPSTAEKKRIVADFLDRCNRYATEQIERYRKMLDAGAPDNALAIQDKIGHWTAYRSFNEHALQELDGKELDDWFDS